MHEVIIGVFLVLFGADLSQALNYTGVNKRGLDHVGLCAGKLGLCYLLLILISLSNEEVIVTRVHNQVTTGLDGTIELAALEAIGGNDDFVQELPGEYVGAVGCIVDD
jgi:hypothetical protein